jgi:hypothetical protein
LDVMRALIFLALVLLVASCSAGAGETPPEREPDIRGTLTAVERPVAAADDCAAYGGSPPDAPVSSDEPPACPEPGDDRFGSVLVEEYPGWHRGGDKLSLAVTDETRILRRTQGGYGPAAFEDFEEGQELEAWTTWAIADSYPGLGTAEAVVILEPGS